MKKHMTLVYLCPFKTHNLYPPLGVAFLAASLRKNNFAASIIDTTFQSEDLICKCIEENSSIAVGFEVLQSNYALSLAVASKVRKRFPGVVIVFGGPFPTTLPDDAMKHGDIDYVLRGEGEVAIIEIMEMIQGERSRSTIDGLCYAEGDAPCIKPARTPAPDLDAIAPAAYDLLQMEQYLKIPMDMPLASPGTTLSVTRGCYGNCIYCQPLSRNLFGNGVRRCSPARTLDEIRNLCKIHGIRSIYFADDEPLWKGEQWWYSVAELLGKSGLKVDIMLNSRVDTVDKTLLKALKKVGLKYLAFGVESGSDTILRNLRKGYSAEKIVPAFELCRNLGIVSRANLMIGSPGESWETIAETVHMLRKARPDVISLSVTTPIPGTDLYTSIQERLGDNVLGSDLFDRKHVISIAECFSVEDIRATTESFFRLFVKMTLHDVLLRPWKKGALIRMLALREFSLAQISPLLPVKDLLFHLGYTKRTFV